MTTAELHAKAQRAAEWLNAGKVFEVKPRTWDGVVTSGWLMVCPQSGDPGPHGLSDNGLIALAKDEGWLDDHVGDANKMVEADGVEWNEWRDVGSLTVYVHVPTEPGQPYWWEVWCSRSRNQLAAGTAPTIDVAKARAVEAARGIG